MQHAGRARHNLNWDDPRLQAIDLQYSDVRAERGLAARLEQRGLLTRMFTDEQVRTAIDSAPTDTRAYFRGECLRRYSKEVAAASWDSVVFDIHGQESLLRIPTLEPTRGTKEHVGELLDSCATAAELVQALTGPTRS